MSKIKISQSLFNNWRKKTSPLLVLNTAEGCNRKVLGRKAHQSNDESFNRFKYKLLEGKEFHDIDQPHWQAGRYFEQELIGASRDGEGTETIPLGRGGKKVKITQQTEAILEFAKEKWSMLKYQTTALQPYWTAGCMSGHPDLVARVFNMAELYYIEDGAVMEVINQYDAQGIEWIIDTKLSFLKAGALRDDFNNYWKNKRGYSKHLHQAAQYVIIRTYQNLARYGEAFSPPFAFIIFRLSEDENKEFIPEWEIKVLDVNTDPAFAEFVNVYQNEIMSLGDEINEPDFEPDVNPTGKNCSSCILTCPFRKVLPDSGKLHVFDEIITNPLNI